MGKVISGAIRTGLGFVSGGLTESLGIGEAIDQTINGKKVKASGGVAAQLEEEKINNSKKRKALYGTSGGVLGQEVNQVGQDNRGNIFGN